MYADDTTLLFTASDHATLQKNMNESLSKIGHWFENNQLTLNIKKTKFIVFGNHHFLSNFNNVNLMYDNTSIERVDKFKYLGVIFDPTLSWTEHVDYMSSIISKRIGVIRRVKFYLPSKTLNMLANALVFPHFDYCSVVWTNFNMEHLNSLQVLQNKLARILLSADIRTSINHLMSSLNWHKLDKRWHNQLLLLVLKCLVQEAPSYLSCQFTYTSSIHSHNTRTQSSHSLVIPSFNVNAGKRTFLYRAGSSWNNLPCHIRKKAMSMSSKSFKTNVLS